MNRTRDQHSALAVNDQCSMVIRDICAKRSRGINAEEPKKNKQNTCRSHCLLGKEPTKQQGKDTLFVFTSYIFKDTGFLKKFVLKQILNLALGYS